VVRHQRHGCRGEPGTALVGTGGASGKLQDEGRLLLAGPYPAVESNDPGPAGYSGSLIIAEFDSLADAQSWAQADPYVQAGVYADINVKPFRKVLP
jgi:hypothetical protein